MKKKKKRNHRKETIVFDRVDKGFVKPSLSREKEIELNKQMSKTMARIRETTKQETCLCCGKHVTSFCNSHNIPKYCLENIGIRGEVSGPNAIYGLPKMGLSIGKVTPGINESGTFNLICRECDSTVFQEYENPNNYAVGKVPSQKMLSQIAMKNYLKFIYKRKMEIALLEDTLQRVQVNSIAQVYLIMEFIKKLEVSRMDLVTYTKCFESAKKYYETGEGSGYSLLYYKLLDYVAPIAIQAPIVISIDLEGKVVNDIFNTNPLYEPKDLHLCIFPQKESTAVFMFIEEGDERYSCFQKQFQKQDDDSKLGIINYLVFLYSEDYFLAKEIGKIIDLASFNEVANLTPVIWSTKPIRNTSVLKKKFILSKWKSIPNLLSKEHKLR